MTGKENKQARRELRNQIDKLIKQQQQLEQERINMEAEEDIEEIVKRYEIERKREEDAFLASQKRKIDEEERKIEFERRTKETISASQTDNLSVYLREAESDMKDYMSHGYPVVSDTEHPIYRDYMRVSMLNNVTPRDAWRNYDNNLYVDRAKYVKGYTDEDYKYLIGQKNSGVTISQLQNKSDLIKNQSKIEEIFEPSQRKRTINVEEKIKNAHAALVRNAGPGKDIRITDRGVFHLSDYKKVFKVIDDSYGTIDDDDETTFNKIIGDYMPKHTALHNYKLASYKAWLKSGKTTTTTTSASASRAKGSGNLFDNEFSHHAFFDNYLWNH